MQTDFKWDSVTGLVKNNYDVGFFYKMNATSQSRNPLQNCCFHPRNFHDSSHNIWRSPDRLFDLQTEGYIPSISDLS
jgi:hypothetical protein